MSWSGLTAALGILGLLTTAIARIAYEQYYRTLGVTLDEVGLSNARMLAWGSFGVLVFVGSAATAAGISVLLSEAVGRFAEHKQVTLLITLVVVLGIEVVLVALWTPTLYVLAFLGAAALVLPLLIPPARRSPRVHRAGVVGAAVAYGVLALIAVTTVHRAGHAALDLNADGDTGKRFVALVLDVAPQRVCVQRVDAGGQEQRLLLGGAHGMVVFYDPEARRVTRVPTGQIVGVDSRRVGEGCVGSQ